MRIIIVILFYSTLIFTQIHCRGQIEPGTPEHIYKVTTEVNDERLKNADATPGDWLSYGRGYKEDRYSALDQINRSNMDSLGLAWSLNLGTTRGIEATPLVVDGIMYVTGPWSMVYAVDTRKAELLWTFDLEVPREYGEIACCDVVNRGVAMYKGQIFLGSLDGRLISIDAATGAKTWEVLTADQSESYTITGAPRIVDGKVIIGNSGAEYGVRGYITAYDALSADQIWRFYTVPGDPSNGFESKAMEAAARTWTGKWWESGGGGTVWDAIVYDPELHLVYVGVGNGSLWNREFRSPEGGDNLYLSSIVALNPDNGALVWYYQTTPGDTWDYTATQQIILADLAINGAKRQVLMQAPKNGFFYVIDRLSGELISADPYVYVNWAKEVDLETGRPVENDFSRYNDSNVQIFPSPSGGHNWQPMAFNPHTQLVYIPARDESMMFGQPANWEYSEDPRIFNIAIGTDENKSFRKDPLAPQRKGKLLAWDPVEKREIWRVEHETTWNAGVLATKELVFQGTAEGNFVAYDADNGEELWRFSVGSGVIAAPISYLVDGKQYITIVSGWGGVGGLFKRYTKQLIPGTIYTFAIGENNPAPSHPEVTYTIIDLPSEASEEEIKNGASLFNKHCARCHGQPGNGGGAMPDLIYSKKEVFDVFTSIVIEGIYLPKGMPGFSDRLNDKELTDIKNYLFDAASEKNQAL